VSRCQLSSALTNDEIEAAAAYQSDGTYFHLSKQGNVAAHFYRALNTVSGEEPCQHPAYAAFLKDARKHQEGLDRAISKSLLLDDAVLYSGHGKGVTIFGALNGPSSAFKGLYYRYPGYISTTPVKLTAEDKFIVDRASEGSQPTLLRLLLPKGFPALDMAFVPGGGNEDEHLVGRDLPFKIVEAEYIRVARVADQVMQLTLVPDP
jgi:hypothetical protein